jgi:hypothetical protein
MNIIYLDQPTAKTMTDMRGLVDVYSKRNNDGRFSEAVDKYNTIYDTLMDEVLGR